MKESTETFTVGGQEIEVSFQYSEPCPGDRWTPPSPGEFYLNKVKFNGVDITDILDHCGSLETLEEEIYEQYIEMINSRKEDQYYG